jgi:parallel beta-helix repeat protein
MEMKSQIRFAGMALALALLATPGSAATFTVTNTADSGAGSLRQAILDANGNPGADTIAFNITGGGPYVITPLSILPLVTETVVIDGTTQPGYAGTPLIELSNFSGAGLRLAGSNSTVRALVLRLFNAGIELEGTGGHHIEGCFIGTDVTGTVASANGSGILIDGGSLGNTIGGATAAARNLISGNSGGIAATNNASTTVIHGNYIGTDVTGTLPVPNINGISMTLAAAAIGGSGPGEGNLISGNTGDGIVLTVGSGSTVRGNLIGTDASGTQPLPNDTGISLGQTNVTVGGTGAGEGNVVAACRIGITSSASGAVIQGNWIGTNAPGTALLGNTETGIEFGSTSTQNTLGGPGAQNVITLNGNGVRNIGTQNAFRANSIFANVALGIDNGPLGVTPNDPGDSDSPGNDLQNFPLITTVEYGASSITINGILTTSPSATFQLDFYSNPACVPRPRDFLQGQTYLGTLPVTTDGTGLASFSAVFPVAVEADRPISATATDAAGNTSEFSQRVVFSIAPVSGPPAGGTTVTLTGTNFLPGATVTFGITPGTGVVVNSATTIHVNAPALAAGSLSDLSVSNTDGTHGTLSKAWVDNFLDVPFGQQFYDWVTKLVGNGITAGVGGGLYGVAQPTLRQQMAVFLLKARHGLCYVPPHCVGSFTDVPCPSTFADWIEALAAEGITGGCGAGIYCPQNPVRRDQMAVFLLKAQHGPAYVPPICTGVFPDVPCPSTFANWIEQLNAEAITGGCGGGNYCPSNPNTRGQMAVFIDKTFGLQ